MLTTCVFVKSPSATFVRERNPRFRSLRVSSPLLPSRRVFLASLCSCIWIFFIFHATNPSVGLHHLPPLQKESSSMKIRHHHVEKGDGCSHIHTFTHQRPSKIYVCVIDDHIILEMSSLLHNTISATQIYQREYICKVNVQENYLNIFPMWKHKNSIKIWEDNGVHLMLNDMCIMARKGSKREIGKHLWCSKRRVWKKTRGKCKKFIINVCAN
jgi:hypothetical protein